VDKQIGEDTHHSTAKIICALFLTSHPVIATLVFPFIVIALLLEKENCFP
jgi:hypothetical protein